MSELLDFEAMSGWADGDADSAYPGLPESLGGGPLGGSGGKKRKKKFDLEKLLDKPVVLQLPSKKGKKRKGGDAKSDDGIAVRAVAEGRLEADKLRPKKAKGAVAATTEQGERGDGGGKSERQHEGGARPPPAAALLSGVSIKMGKQVRFSTDADPPLGEAAAAVAAAAAAAAAGPSNIEKAKKRNKNKFAVQAPAGTQAAAPQKSQPTAAPQPRERHQSAAGAKPQADAAASRQPPARAAAPQHSNGRFDGASGSDSDGEGPAPAPLQPAAPAAAAASKKERLKEKRRRKLEERERQQVAGAGQQLRQQQQRQQPASDGRLKHGGDGDHDDDDNNDKSEEEEKQDRQRPAAAARAPGAPRAALASKQSAQSAAATAPKPGALGSLGSGGSSGGGSNGGGGLVDKMRAHLQGARFRQLNEALYTRTGQEALAMVAGQPSLFKSYHAGFQQQVKAWPRQPVDLAIRWLSAKSKHLVVADFGCGDAKLSASVPQEVVHSLDLVAQRPGVIACNMAATPLAAASVDVAVFSLSLMGTDYGSFLVEAARVLKPNGWLWVAEVRSRFSTAGGGGGGEELLKPFVSCLGQLGFKLLSQDQSDTMFVIMVFKKAQDASGGGGGVKWPHLKACVYKKR